jgi:hypothetical protein
MSSPSLRRYYPDQVRGCALRPRLWDHPERHPHDTPWKGTASSELPVRPARCRHSVHTARTLLLPRAGDTRRRASYARQVPSMRSTHRQRARHVLLMALNATDEAVDTGIERVDLDDLLAPWTEPNIDADFLGFVTNREGVEDRVIVLDQDANRLSGARSKRVHIPARVICC